MSFELDTQKTYTTATHADPGTATLLDSSHVQTSLGRIRIRVGGEGPALLFWPSLLMDGSMWLAQAAYFMTRYRVVLVDPPGHGDSEPLARSFSLAECAHCVAQILDELKIERVHFIGNSWGGMLGGTFAALYPERIGLAVLMNGTASSAGLRQKLEFLALIQIVRMAGKVPEPLVKRAVRAFLGPTSERDRPRVVEQIRESVKHLNARSACWAIYSLVPARPDQRQLFRSIRTPVLVVAGAEDRTFPVAETQAMAAAIPGAEFIVMPATAHLAGLECPREVNAIIEEYLQRQR
jgi:3-oxoadipate enol-lactonase